MMDMLIAADRGEATDEVFDAAQDKYSEAYRQLLPATRRELVSVPREVDG
jgi:hypothetical protein